MKVMCRCLVGWVSVLFLGVFMFAATTAAHAMSEEELKDLYLDVVEQSVAAFEPLWHEYSDEIPHSGFFDIGGYGNWRDDEYISAVTIPCNGMLILCYSVLLNETEKQEFSELRVPRETLREHAVKAIRWCALTSGYVANAYPYPIKGVSNGHLTGKYWIRKHGSPVDTLGWYSVGVANLWSELDEETKSVVQQLMVGAAAKEAYPYEWKYASGGHHDRIKQDMASTIGAAFLFPDVEAANPCRNVVAQQCTDMVATLHDRTCSTVVDGKPVSEWYRAWHLYEDYSSDHHAWAQLWYGCDLIFEGRTYLELMSALTGQPPLEEAAYPDNGFDGVLEWVKGISLPQAEPASVHGIEYDAYYGTGLLAYCYGAVIKKDPVAAALEERAAQLLKTHISAVKLYDYHRNSYAKAAAAYLMHKVTGPRAEPVPFEEAWRSLSGSYYHQGHQNLVHRSARKWVSFAWDSTSRKGRGPQGYVVPASSDGAAPDPLIYFMPQSIAGDVAMFDVDGKLQNRQPETLYAWDADDSGFHTAGRARDPWLDRYCAFFSFGDGPDVLLTVLQARKDSQLSWAGVPVCFYAREGLTGPRRYRDAESAFELGGNEEHVSNRWCVDDTIGLAIAGGNGRAKVERKDGYNWARTAAYRDKMDCVFASPIRRSDLKAGEIGADVAAAIFAHTDGERIAKAAEGLQEAALKLPEGWRGMVVPHATVPGRRYLTVANFWGQMQEAFVELSFPEGAPVVSRQSLIRGRKGLLPVELASPASYGDEMELYVSVPEGQAVKARRLSVSQYKLEPAGGVPVKVELQYAVADDTPIKITAQSDGQALPVDTKSGTENRICTLTITKDTVVQVASPQVPDTTPPFINIDDLSVREDERVAVRVIARDGNGIESVELLCDGESQGAKSETPYTWVLRPGPGWHTFQAVAVDASPQGNQRRSFKRTIEVKKP